MIPLSVFNIEDTVISRQNWFNFFYQNNLRIRNKFLVTLGSYRTFCKLPQNSFQLYYDLLKLQGVSFILFYLKWLKCVLDRAATQYHQEKSQHLKPRRRLRDLLAWTYVTV